MQQAGFLAAVSAVEAWRATPGSCTGETAELQHTTDAGATWQAVDLGQADLRSVLALQAGPDTVSTLRGAGDACERQLWSSPADGTSWTRDPDGAASLPFADVDTSTVTFAGGAVPSPCDSPNRVTRQATTDAVACVDAFSTWVSSEGWISTSVPGLLDLATTDRQFVAAVGGIDGCEGVAVQTINAPITPRSYPSTIGCATDVPADAGTVLLATAGGAVWLSNADRTLVSTDGGVTW